MSFTRICDHCHQATGKNYIHIDYNENNKYINKDYHIDCFNYKFSCNIRNIKEKENANNRPD